MAEPRPPRRLRSVPAGARVTRESPRARAVETIRPAQADEAAEIAAVYLASRRHAAGLIPRARHTDEEVRTWLATVVLPEHDVFVAESGERIVAFLVLRGDSLDQLYVHPGHQRRGIGSRLLAHARGRRRRIRLYTFEANEPARAFYEKHGFRAIAFGDGTANEEGLPDVLYEWTAR